MKRWEQPVARKVRTEMDKSWHKAKESFPVIDVRKLTGNFLPMIIKKAKAVPSGGGICIVQTFDPIPLYSTMEALGFEHITEQASPEEYRVYFYRIEEKTPEGPGALDVPFKPVAILNFKNIDNELAKIVVNFWKLIWEPDHPVIDRKTRYLLSLANAVGAGRYRQALRELIKAYADGVTVAEMDELFALFVWNQGVGTFASEIGPSPLFRAYQTIKRLEEKGISRDEVLERLMEKFGKGSQTRKDQE